MKNLQRTIDRDVVISKVRIVMMLAMCFRLLAVLECAASDVERDGRPIALPPLRVFDGRMDIAADEIIGWMNVLEARMESTQYDCRIRCELSEVVTTSGTPSSLESMAIAFRNAKSPASDAERFIVVHQNVFDNLPIATGNGVAIDKRKHYDMLRIGKKCLSSSLTAFDYNVSRMESEVRWEEAEKYLPSLRVFNPIRACTTSVTAVESGRAMRINQHSVTPRTVKAVVMDQDEYVHVLLELRVANSDQKNQIMYSFKNEVPVQYTAWDSTDKSSGKVKPTKITRSIWKSFGEKEDKMLLPVSIRGVIDLPHNSSEMEIEIEWTVGEKVDKRLFEKSSLGLLSPVDDVVVGIPLRLEEMVKDVIPPSDSP